MTAAPSPADAIAEDFAEQATARAREVRGKPGLVHAGPDRRGFFAFHCPLPGPESGPHQANGEPQAWCKVAGGTLQAGCSKCSGGKADTSYLEKVKAAIAWSDNVERPEFGAATWRHHEYQTADGQWSVRHSKCTFKDRRKSPIWQWGIADRAAAAFSVYRPFKPSDWAAEHYPELKSFTLALRLYRQELLEAAPTATAVICEGERDVDSFNSLGTGLVATCLPHQTPAALAAHQRAALEGREVVLLGDADEGGRRFVAAWGAILWEVASSIRIFPPELLEPGDGKDLTDHVERAEAAGASRAAIGARLLDQIAGLPAVEESMARVDWRAALAVTRSTGATRDSGGNAKLVLTLHPEVAGRLRFNVRSGEVEALETPWGDTVGAHRIAAEASIWLETAEQIHIKPRSFEEALVSTTVAPPYDPLAELAATAWDGTPRLDGLFTRYLPLAVGQAQAVQLARLLMADLVATLRNELARQRLIVGVATDLELDVAGALLGAHGVQYYGGTVREAQLRTFAYEQAALVQVAMTTISDRQVARFSLPQIFSPHVQIGPRKISSPVFLAVGEREAGTGRHDPRCIAVDLSGPPLIDALAADGRQILAEAFARAAELKATPALTRDSIETVDEIDAREGARRALELIYAYSTRRSDAATLAAALHAQPLEQRRHVVRELCLAELRMAWTAAWHDTPAQERAFNAACRAMGWFGRGRPVVLDITRKQASDLGLDIGRREKATVPGVRLTTRRWQELEDFLFGEGPTPEGGSAPDGSDTSDSVPIPNNPNKHSVPILPMPSNSYAREDVNDTLSTRRRACNTIKKETTISEVRAILAEPGACALDFETWPTDPSWHGERAAAAAPRGGKAAARERARHEAERAGRAHARQPCILSLAHENGREAVVRLEPGDLHAMFEGRRATLIGHSAQFEIECLLAADVAADVEDTMLAAKCLHLTAVDEDSPQPVDFSLAALVERELGRARDKTVRDRDWREPLDDEAIAYCLADARDCLGLWQAYRLRLEEAGLLEGYQLIARAILPTAAINLAGMEFDSAAHAALVTTLRADAGALERELGRICLGAVANHGSPAQIGDWIFEEVLNTPIRPPVEPRLRSLLEFLRGKGGLRPDLGGELAARDLPRGLLGLAGMSLEEATLAAWSAGYIGHEHDRWSDDGTRPEQDELLAAIDRELAGDRVLTLDDHGAWDGYLAAKANFDARHRDDPERLANFCARLQARCGVTWRRTKSGSLAVTKALKPRMAAALEGEFPVVARYLRTHAQWTHATKLLGTFGESLRGWVDADGRLRGQLKVGGTVTLRHSASRPNVQQMPREASFRALFRAPPGRALVVCDYSQIELRLAAIIAPDEALLEVYRSGADVHAEVAAEIGLLRGPQSKGVSFSMIYGAGVGGVAEAAGLSLERAGEVVERFLGAYPGLRAYRERAPREAEQLGYIPIRPGRRVRYDTALSKPTQAINFQVQGAAASVQMRALRRVYDALPPEVHLVGAIHDEIILESPAEHAEAAASLLQREMRAALVELFPESKQMGADRLAEAVICQSWAEKG
jgi:DNA polymerase I-like protein with 3'-5' exonuclease and polymerase domains